MGQVGWISQSYVQDWGPGVGGPCHQWTRKVKERSHSGRLIPAKSLSPLDIRWHRSHSAIDIRWKNTSMRQPDLLQGTLDMLILKVLARGALHGYAVAERIQRLSDDVLSVGEGSLYPALYRLQEQGWITSEWGQSENNRRAKYYTLTKAGRKQLEAEAAGWEQMTLAIARIMQTA